MRFHCCKRKQIFSLAVQTPVCVNNMSPGWCCFSILCRIFIYDVSEYMNGNIQNLVLSICMILTLSIIVSTSPSGFILFMFQLCFRNISWLPGNAAQVCSLSWVLLKKS